MFKLTVLRTGKYFVSYPRNCVNLHISALSVDIHQKQTRKRSERNIRRNIRRELALEKTSIILGMKTSQALLSFCMAPCKDDSRRGEFAAAPYICLPESEVPARLSKGTRPYSQNYKAS